MAHRSMMCHRRPDHSRTQHIQHQHRQGIARQPGPQWPALASIAPHTRITCRTPPPCWPQPQLKLRPQAPPAQAAAAPNAPYPHLPHPEAAAAGPRGPVLQAVRIHPFPHLPPAPYTCSSGPSRPALPPAPYTCSSGSSLFLLTYSSMALLGRPPAL